MQLIYLSNFVTIIMDILAWYFFHLFISWSARRLPDHFFEEKAHWFETQEWEKTGELWQQLFRVRSWKPYLPDGTQVTKKGFNKKHLRSFEQESLAKFVLETRRAEFAHWVMIPPAVVFFLWNPPWAGWIMIAYAVLFNLPFIIVQRYNRPRLERLLQRKSQRVKVEERVAL